MNDTVQDVASGSRPGRYVIAVDIGGTFTDCVILSVEGTVTLAKAFSTPPDFSRGIFDALEVAAQELELDQRSILSGATLFLHSTTVAENALVAGSLATAALLTTRGHEDTLRAMRGGYGRWSGLTDDEKRNVIETDKPPPLVPRGLIYGIGERVDTHGDILQSADPDEIEAALRAAIQSGAEAIGACFLWSFANPRNELVVAEVARRVCPELFLTLSHQVAPILGEYERTSTVALNSRLGPVVRGYLDSLTSRLKDEGFGGTLLVMQAHGGLLPIDVAAERPVAMLESGPVSGIVGAAHQGRAMGLGNIIAADMGGTTFKVGVVRDGLVEYQREPMVLRYHYALPKMDVVSLGLAGGSVISIEPRTGLPQIGPHSAGSYPGPVCYDHGGEEPTITDVDAILGYLNPSYFVGGRTTLNVEKAAELFTKTIAEPLQLSTMDAAAAIYKMANSMMFDLLHKITVRRGIDPRGFALFSYGGTAGMHVAAYGRDLGVDPIVVPYAAAVQGAYGLVISDVVHEEQVTRPMVVPADLDQVNTIVAGLRDAVDRQLQSDGFSAEQCNLEYYIDVSYRRQVHILTVPLDVGLDAHELVSGAAIETAISRFEQLYREKYGPESGYREAGIELVTFRVRGSGLLPKLEPHAEPAAPGDASSALVEMRSAWVAEHERIEEVPGYAYADLHHGAEIKGPAIIWTPITTVVVAPSQVARLDQHRNLLLWRSDRDSASPDDAAVLHSPGPISVEN